MSPQEIVDERAPLLPSSSPPVGTSPDTNKPDYEGSEAEDPIAIEVNRKLAAVDIAWRIIFTVFAGFLLAITIKAIIDTEHTDVRLILFPASLCHIPELKF
jgi:hypothetical protein